MKWWPSSRKVELHCAAGSADEGKAESKMIKIRRDKTSKTKREERANGKYRGTIQWRRRKGYIDR